MDVGVGSECGCGEMWVWRGVGVERCGCDTCECEGVGDGQRSVGFEVSVGWYVWSADACGGGWRSVGVGIGGECVWVMGCGCWQRSVGV